MKARLAQMGRHVDLEVILTFLFAAVIAWSVFVAENLVSAFAMAMLWIAFSLATIAYEMKRTRRAATIPRLRLEGWHVEQLAGEVTVTQHYRAGGN